jgi:DNA polymerase III epsilon subunit-like protein
MQLATTLPNIEDVFWWLGYLGIENINNRQTALVRGVDYIVFDTETDGGRGGQLIVQLAFAAYDKHGNELHRNAKYFQLPAGRTINPHARAVHGISDATLAQKGVHPIPELENFFWWVRRASRVVAHNASFDARAIHNTCVQHGVDSRLPDDKLFCTMLKSKPIAGLLNKRGHLKNPKNSELYELLHGKPPEGQLHDALADVLVTASNYAQGVHENWW